MNNKCTTPIYRKIEDDLKAYIAEQHLPRHTLLPSEADLANKYGVCINTVRKALGNLASEKVIYRHHGQGTFVAPRIRKQKVLMVTNLKHSVGDTDNDYFRFFAGALSEANHHDLPYEPMLVQLDDFMANLDDVSMVYPEVGGVIFFRGVDNWVQSRSALERQGVPMMFYGPDLQEERKVTCCRMFHREEQIAMLGMNYLRERGYKRIGVCVETNQNISLRRQEWFHRVKESGLVLQDYSLDRLRGDASAMQDMAQAVDVMYCPTDILAIALIQALELDAGVRVPEDLAVMGVDNISSGSLLRPQLTTISLCNYTNGGRAMRLFSEYLQGGSSEPFEEDATLKLVVRQSC